MPDDSGRAIRPATCSVILIACMFFGCCCPPHLLWLPIFLVQYGHLPSTGNRNDVEEGMTHEQVVAIMGTPHKREDDRGRDDRWTFYHDCIGFSFTVVWFDKDGRSGMAWTD